MESAITKEEILALVQQRDLHGLRDKLIECPEADIAEVLADLPPEDRLVVIRILPRELATGVFEFLPTDAQSEVVTLLGDSRVAVLLNEMAADDRTALFEEMPAAVTRKLLMLLSKDERLVALTLLGYPESSVGRLMTPDYIEIKENWTINRVFDHIRESGRESDSFSVLYVVGEKGRLLHELRIRNLLLADPVTLVSEIKDEDVVWLSALDDQEKAVSVFTKYGREVLPVIDSDGHMLGIVTVDDVLEVAEEEATEDIHKLGGTEALSDPYIKVPFLTLVRTRASWLIVLFIGEMLTASAMASYESEIEKAVLLALFIPLIISSGGNSGSQAATLVIRALSLQEIGLKDWFRVFRREIASGLLLGSVLGIIGFFRIVVWSQVFPKTYGPEWLLLAVTVMFSLVAVVMWGTITGAMLPFLLKRVGADPATSSAPFVATLVDVVGLVIYFTIASYVLHGALL